MPSTSRPRLSPKVRELVATDRLARPRIGRLSATQAAQLADVARRARAFELNVSPARAIRALAEGAQPDVAMPVLQAILADGKAPVPERIAAARGLGQIATPTAERALLRHIRARDPRVQQEIVAALGRFAGPSARRGLRKIDAPADLATYRQWVFASALISYRYGLEGPFLPEALFVERSRGRPGQMTTFTARTKTAKATKAARAKLSGPDYGIDFAERCHSIKCGSTKWEILVNRELGRSSPTLERLFERPWIAGVLAQWLPREERLQSRFVLLTKPTGETVQLDVVRADGEIVYTGTAARSGSDVRFRVSDVVRAGTAPLNVLGRVSRSGIGIESATVFSARVAGRRALAAIN
jgi:HEAT repeat protein